MTHNHFSNKVNNNVKNVEFSEAYNEKKKGRKKGQVNLKAVKDDNGEKVGVKNKHGVEFTLKEKKQFEARVKNIWKKQERLKNDELGLLFGYNKKGELKNRRDFLLLDHSTSLHQFKSRADFEHYFEQVKYASAKGYEQEQVGELKRSYIEKVREKQSITDDQADIIEKKIKEMTDKEFALRYGLNYVKKERVFESEQDAESSTDVAADIISGLDAEIEKTRFDERKEAYSSFLDDFGLKDCAKSRKLFDKYYQK